MRHDIFDPVQVKLYRDPEARNPAELYMENGGLVIAVVDEDGQIQRGCYLRSFLKNPELLDESRIDWQVMEPFYPRHQEATWGEHAVMLVCGLVYDRRVYYLGFVEKDKKVSLIPEDELKVQSRWV